MRAPGEIKQELLLALEQCAVLQREHLVSLRDGKMNNIKQWREERQQLLHRLQYFFSKAGEAVQENDFVKTVQLKLARILVKEEKLKSAVCEQRQDLAVRLTKMRKGKLALGGYKMRQTAQAPRFLSSKG